MKRVVSFALVSVLAVAGQVTIYNGFASVEESKEIHHHIIAPLPKSIDPRSIVIDNARGSYRFIPGGFDKRAFLRHFLGKEVEFDRGKKSFRGKIVSIDPLIIQTPKRVFFDVDFYAIHFPKVSIQTAPSLYVDEPSNGTVTMRYITNNIRWSAHYTATLGAQLDLRGTIKIDDKSGYRYTNVKLAVVAGDVRKSTPRPRPIRMMAKAVMMEAAAPVAPRAVQGVYRYDIPGRWDLKDGTFIPFLTLHLPYTMEYRADLYNLQYSRATQNLKFRRIVTFRTPKPLPAGSLYIYGEETFLGQTHIADTAPDTNVHLDLGRDFDLKLHAVTKEYENSKTFFRSHMRYTVKNPKSKDVRVQIFVHLPWPDTRMSSERNYRKIDASTILFTISVPAKSSRTFEVTYNYHKK